MGIAEPPVGSHRRLIFCLGSIASRPEGIPVFKRENNDNTEYLSHIGACP